MKGTKMKKLNSYKPFILFFLAGVFFWITDSILDFVTVTHSIKYTLIDELFHPSINDIFQRSFFFLICIISAFLVFKLMKEAAKNRDLEKLASTELTKSENRYKTLFESTGTATVVVDKNMNIIEVNSMCEKLTGYTKREILKKNQVQNFFQDVEFDKIKKHHINRRNGVGAPPEYETIFIKKNGELRNLLIQVNIIPETKMSVASAIDITSRKKAEKDLFDSNEKYMSLFNSIRNSILVANINREIIELNPAFSLLFGYSKKELLGKNTFNIHENEDSYSNFGEKIEENMGGNGFIETTPYRKKSGEVFPGETSLYYFRDNNNNIIGYIALIRDITSRLKREQDLRESEARINSIFRAAPTGIGVVRDRIILQVNKQLCEMTGFSSDELIGKSSRIVYATEEDYNYVGKEKYNQIKNGGTGNIETKWKRKDGEIIDIFLNSSLIDPDDPSKGVTFTALDITERKIGEEKLKKYSENLELMVEECTIELKAAHEKSIREEKLAVLGQLAGSVGHELRNPLGVISNAVYYLKLVLSDVDCTIKKYLDTIDFEVKRSITIVTDLLDLSRNRPAKRELIEVSISLEEVLDKYNPPKNIEVITKFELDLPKLYIDPHHIEQILENLVTNAYQAMPQGGVLTIESTLEENLFKISISDTGIGVSKKNMKNLFEPLFTTKARGIGLGLTVSKNLAIINGGDIKVESKEEEGTTFTVIFPTKKEEVKK